MPRPPLYEIEQRAPDRLDRAAICFAVLCLIYFAAQILRGLSH